MQKADERQKGRKIVGVLRFITAMAALTAAVALPGSLPAGAITEGEIVPISDRPFQVSIHSDFYGEAVPKDLDAESELATGHMCGGSIMDAETIITAAHCITDTTADELLVLAGVDDTEDYSGQLRYVSSARFYSEYAETERGDIAVLKLSEPLTFDESVQPIALASSAEIADATEGTVSGWGMNESRGFSEELRAATIPLVDDATCTELILDEAENEGEDEQFHDADLWMLQGDESALCAGGATGADSCQGDSGGPLTIATDTGPKLAGVVSAGVTHCGAAVPAVYTEIPFYDDFLADPSTGIEADGCQGSIGFDCGTPTYVWIAAAAGTVQVLNVLGWLIIWKLRKRRTPAEPTPPAPKPVVDEITGRLEPSPVLTGASTRSTPQAGFSPPLR